MTNLADYAELIARIKSNIRQSRYQAARSVNRELLLLYYGIGSILTERIREEEWGVSVLSRISEDIQQEFKGIRGFSVSNMKNMKLFFLNYSFLGLVISATSNAEKSAKGSSNHHERNIFGKSQTLSGQIHATGTHAYKDDIKSSHEGVTIANVQAGPIVESMSKGQGTNMNGKSQAVPVQIHAIAQHSVEKRDFHDFLSVFLQLGFTHNMTLIQKCPTLKERFFYMKKAVNHQWSYRVLQYHVDSALFQQQGKMTSNFERTLPEKIRKHAMEAFRDEYLLNFISATDEDAESVLEDGIVKNVKRFMLSLGTDFAFMGNQYRLVVEGDEFFVDLLFFHRGLQAMVAIELKNGKFRPEFAGKMNFYLAALDELLRRPNENPSIGIILCREKKNMVVEFAFRKMDAPMGVATYQLEKKLPESFRGYLPGPEEFMRLFEEEKCD